MQVIVHVVVVHDTVQNTMLERKRYRTLLRLNWEASVYEPIMIPYCVSQTFCMHNRISRLINADKPQQIQKYTVIERESLLWGSFLATI